MYNTFTDLSVLEASAMILHTIREENDLGSREEAQQHWLAMSMEDRVELTKRVLR